MNQTRTRSLGLALAGSALFALGLGLGQRRAQADDAKLAKPFELDLDQCEVKGGTPVGR